MTYEGHARGSNRVLIALVVITIFVVAYWAANGGLDQIPTTEQEQATLPD